MSDAEDVYSSRPTSQVFNSTYGGNGFGPPPPPPKPSSHQTSGRGTPANSGPPLPPIPSQAGTSSPVISSTPHIPPHPSQIHLDQAPTPSLTPQINPPSVEDNWVPAVLLEKSTTDLAPILSNPTLLSSLSTLHPSHAASVSPLSTQLNSNVALSTHVLETASHLAQLREQSHALLLQHTNLSTQWRKKQSEMDKALEPWSPKAMYQRLVASIAEQEAVVRAVEESFLEGGNAGLGSGGLEDFYGEDGAHGGGNRGSGGKASDRDVGDWVKRIREGVQTLEMRKEMRERWDEGRVGGWR